jgi:hypothetical protein
MKSVTLPSFTVGITTPSAPLRRGLGGNVPVVVARRTWPVVKRGEQTVRRLSYVSLVQYNFLHHREIPQHAPVFHYAAVAASP